MDDEALYFSINRPEHWSRRGLAENLDVGETVRLRSDARYGVLDTASFGELEGVGAVRAFAVGVFGRLILLDEAGDLWTYDRHSRHHERLFVSRHGLFSASAMLAATGDTLFVADPEGERTLAAYDVNSGQTRWSRAGDWMDGVYCRPLALYADGRGVYVLTFADQPSEEEEEEEGRAPLSGKVALRILRLGLSGGLIAAIEDDRFALKLPADGGKHGQPFLTVSPLGDMYVYDSLGRALFAFSAAGELLTRMMLPPPFVRRSCRRLEPADLRGRFAKHGVRRRGRPVYFAVRGVGRADRQGGGFPRKSGRHTDRRQRPDVYPERRAADARGARFAAPDARDAGRRRARRLLAFFGVRQRGQGDGLAQVHACCRHSGRDAASRAILRGRYGRQDDRGQPLADRRMDRAYRSRPVG
ncbi:hypothetical protein [Cohnella rhizosphaerae]|uniref:Uncharacterized protein n=1 Tax=Cohnella rhizosphaerae TaxID=1457232 RepID=A0A9X4QX13_9BACL|nr:hypothetical protein [Cohnella rhizosphaerae]MDG0812937.1 hypothetical protein [Cohnella rhizosphaerae]